jgi:glycosyltransferase involved in cell wall biosynthesis
MLNGGTKASLIIPTYNRGDVLLETLRMALAQTYHDCEVIVVDQTATVSAGLRAFLNCAGDRIRYIRLPFPNLPAARNAGVLAAHGEIIIFVDDDVVFGRDYIGLHVRRYSDPSVGAVMGLTLSPGGASDEETLAAARSLFGSREALADGLFSVSWVIGCNSSYRRRAILEAGMSDERFTGGACAEDVDLAVRVRHSGYKLLLDPRIRLTHLALPSGGCGNRTGDRDARELESCRLFLFFSIKNWNVLGPCEVLFNVWRSYRGYAFNRRLVQQRNKLMKRQYLFIHSILAAFRMLRFDSNRLNCERNHQCYSSSEK